VFTGQRRHKRTAFSIGSDGLDGLGANGFVALQITPASAAYPAANRAYYVPFTIQRQATALQMWTYNGATASGKVDVGIYDSAGNRLVDIGIATNQAGTTTLQFYNLTDTVLVPGVYYMAVQKDDAVGTFFRYATSVKTVYGAMGLLAQDVGSFGLPSTATMTEEQGTATGYLPIFGIQIATTAF